MDRHQRIRLFAAFAALLTALAVSAVIPALATGQSDRPGLLELLGLRGERAADVSPPAEAGAGKAAEQPAYGSNGSRHRRGGEGRERAGANGSSGLGQSSSPSTSGGSSGTAGGLADAISGGSSGSVADEAPAGQTGVVSLFGFEAIPPLGDGSDGTEPGLLGQVQRDLLDAICSGSGGQLCLSVVVPDPEGTEPAGNGPGSTSADPRTALNAFRVGARGDGTAQQLLAPGSTGRPSAATGSRPGESRALLGTTAPLPCEASSGAGFAAFAPVRSFVCSPASLAAGHIPVESTSDSTHWLGDVRGLALFAFEILVGVVILLIPLIIERRRRPAY
jgi:hypothetical protein